MSVAISDLNKRWPASIVPVSKTKLTTQGIKTAVDQAIDFYGRFTSFNFVERDTQEHYIEFHEDPNLDVVARSTHTGRDPANSQSIFVKTPNADELPEMVSHILHELGHALGLKHEQQRPDRKDFVVVNTQYIPANAQGDFTPLDKDEAVLPTSYDYGSRMQYRTNAFNSNGKVTIDIQIKPDQPQELVGVIGTAKLASRRDVQTLNYIASPLQGPPLATGSWNTIHDGHQLVAISDDLIVDWEGDTGHYRLWRFDADAKGAKNPLSAAGLPAPAFPVTGNGHVLVAVEDGMMIDWQPATGSFRLWNLAQSSIRSGHWDTIRQHHHLVYVGGRRLLDWDDDGGYRLWKFDAADSNLLSGPIASGTWNTIDGHHELILLTDGNLLDRKDDEYRVWTVNRGAQGGQNPLTDVLAAGKWETIDHNHRLVPVGAHRVLDWEDNGNYRVWNYPARFDSYRPNPLSQPTHHGHHSSLGNASAVELENDHLLTWNPYDSPAKREYRLWRLNYGHVGGDALELVRTDKLLAIKGDQLVALPGMRILDFNPAGKSTVFEYQLDKPAEPFLKKTITAYQFTTIDSKHTLVRLAGDRVLDWWFDPQPNASNDLSRFRVWEYDSSATGGANPFPGNPKSQGSWKRINMQMMGPQHTLVPVNGAYVIDCVRAAAFYRIWKLDIHQPETILPLPTLAEGFWSDFEPGTQLIGLAGERVMDWDDKGNYRITNFSVTPALRLMAASQTA